MRPSIPYRKLKLGRIIVYILSYNPTEFQLRRLVITATKNHTVLPRISMIFGNFNGVGGTACHQESDIES
jgi:hypothetical protein